MQTYALFIAAGFRINENALALKGCPPVRQAPTQADYVFLELSVGEETAFEAKMRRLVKEAKREKGMPERKRLILPSPR